MPALDTWVLDAQGPLSNPIPHSLEDEVLDAIDELPDDMTELIRMRYYEQLTFEEIALERGWVTDDGRPKRNLAHYHVGMAERALRRALEGRVDYEDGA